MKILFFSPNLAIIPHTSAEFRLAKILSRYGHHEVKFLICGRFFKQECTISRYLGYKTTNDLTIDENACLTCNKALKISKIERLFNTNELNEFFTNEDEAIIQKLRDEILLDPINYHYKAIPFGHMAAYELILELKKKDLNFSDSQNLSLSRYIENCLRTYFAAKRYFTNNEIDRVVIFNPQYGVGAAFSHAASEFRVRVDYFSFSNVLSEMRQYVRIWSWDRYHLNNPALVKWQHQLVNVVGKDKQRLARYLKFIDRGKSPWTYSQPPQGVDSRKHFRIEPEKRILLAVMNSSDEVLAAVTSGVWPKSKIESHVFINQEEWIRELIDFARRRADLVLIVRPHPRELPNKRESVLAEINHSRDNLFSNLPPNVIIDDPAEGFSIQDHFSAAQAITTGWSSVGLEWQIKGKICITYDSNLPGYPKETHLSGKSREEYFRNIELALTSDSSQFANFSSEARDWFVYSNFRGTVRLGSSIFDEGKVGEFLAWSKIKGFLHKIFPRIKIWLDLHSPGIKTEKELIVKYFSGDRLDLLN
jgi:hypothetical protein